MTERPAEYELKHAPLSNEPTDKIALDWNHATTARLMDNLINAGDAEVVPAFTKVLKDADGMARKSWLYAAGVNALHHARRQQGQLDDETFVSVVALVGVSLSLVGLDANLASHAEELPGAKHGGIVGFAPNASDRVYVWARGPGGLARSPLAGWQILADGTSLPVPAGKPPGRWCAADEANASAVWPDGRIVNLGEAEAELMEYDR